MSAASAFAFALAAKPAGQVGRAGRDRAADVEFRRIALGEDGGREGGGAALRLPDEHDLLRQAEITALDGAHAVENAICLRPSCQIGMASGRAQPLIVGGDDRITLVEPVIEIGDVPLTASRP